MPPRRALQGFHAACEAPEGNHRRRHLGFDVVVQLFDLNRFRSKVLPAIEDWRTMGSLSPLLAEATRRSKGAGERVPPGDDLRRIVTSEAVPILVESCVEWGRGFSPSQDLSDSAIVEYLRDRSAWVAQAIIIPQPLAGGPLSYSWGAGSETFSPGEVLRFREELDAIDPPDDVDDPESDFENLRRIVDTAATAKGLTLIRTMC